MKEGIALVTVLLVVVAGVFFWNDISAAFTGDSKNKQEKLEKKDKNSAKVKTEEINGDPIQVMERFDLPKELKEISGINYQGEDLFACVEDEQGTVYFYNTESNRIEKQFDFSGAGDFEGITQTPDALYVVRADGKLYELRNHETGKPTVREFETGLTIKDNVESLCYDEEGKRLLLTGKDENKSRKGKRDVYAFDPATGKSTVLFSIDLSSGLLNKNKKGEVKFSPSGMGVHPVSKEIYITDGPAAAIYKLDREGKIVKVYKLDSKQIPQVEGISFSPEGEIFISTEGPKDPAAILKVKLD